MKKNIADIENEGNDCEFYLATKSEKNDFLIYASDLFKFSEIDLINLIKVCLIEARNKTIGKKLLAVYRDSTLNRQHITQARLKMIGISEEAKPEPITKRKPKLK